ncbi:MAG: homoserine kinase, partial [Peptostreptococcaceae bacterium]
IYNISRASLLVSSLINKKYDLLKIACKDALHQDYRGPLIHNYYDIVSKSYELESLGVFLSGAGPTIMSINQNNTNDFLNGMKLFLETLEHEWCILKLSCDYNGTIVNKT